MRVRPQTRLIPLITHPFRKLDPPEEYGSLVISDFPINSDAV